MSQEELASLSGVAKRTIVRFEQDLSVPYERTLRDIQRVLEGRGIEFQFEGQIGVGLRVNSQKRNASAPSSD
jgi:transcriptional regulator with XRE-family HTH domain